MKLMRQFVLSSIKSLTKFVISVEMHEQGDFLYITTKNLK